MANHTCNQTCGCRDTYVVTQPCPPSCPEVFNSQCIVYTGTNILCGLDTVISRYDYLDTVITKLVNYFCTRFANAPVTIVESDSIYIDVTSSIVGFTTTYVLDLDFAQLQADLNLTLPIYNVVGSDNVFVATTVVGTTTIFTLSAFETEVINTDGLLNVTANITPGVDIIYTVNVDLVALTAALPQTSVIGGPSANSFITTSVVGNMTTYSVDSKESIVAAGDNVTVTATGGTAPNYDTTYTVDSEAATLALLAGEAYLDLVSAYNAGTHITAYTLSLDIVALDVHINAEIDDVFDNTVGGFGIDAVYSGAGQTLTINFDGAAVAVGGGVVGLGTLASPFALDTNVPRKYVLGATNIPASGTITITHNLNTLSVMVSGTQAVLPFPFTTYVHGSDYTYEIVDPNTITVTDATGGGLTDFSALVIG